jgi:tyrosyl-tRNA synthetase
MYQYWMNVTDDDAARYLKIFTFLKKEEIEALVSEHEKAPHNRTLQKKLAEEVTAMVHSRKAVDTAVEASGILFGKGTNESLKRIDESTFLSVFEGVPQYTVDLSLVTGGCDVTDLLTEKTGIFPSKGELRRMIKGGGLSINKEKVTSTDEKVSRERLINEKYILVQKGKKNYYLIRTN